MHESRTGAEGCVGGGGIALFGFSLSIGDICTARARVVDDV
jgi:hypothetical protein